MSPVWRGQRAESRGAVLVAALLSLGLCCCAPAADARRDAQGVVRLRGESMGSTWSLIAVPGTQSLDPDDLVRTVQEQLDRIDQVFSTWKPESPLSRFNRAPEGASWELEGDAAQLLELCRELWERSGGAFDPSVAPLVEAFGFGAAGDRGAPLPTPDELSALRQRVGFDGLEWRRDPQRPDRVELLKRRPGLALDLSGVAPGFAADRIARALEPLALGGLFLEVGGEVLVVGQSPRGDAWRVGIEAPTVGSTEHRLQLAVQLEAGGVATSGDYRNFREVDGRRFAHTIDPRSGAPVTAAPASVTVIAPDCATADGLATALTVLGPAAGLPWIETLPDCEALFLLRREDGELEAHRSAGFAAFEVTVP
jgi:thiamine biosynthesis lipoprotein